ncbi:adenylate cyclase, class 2 [Frankia sp. AiPs1]|uniref:class IV adenylate cyclase n=1 Tax=Frankia sp. AiPa1 TaxID=573492 RepID=UPI00202AC44F|nr:CYTH domain-containing protein [Frankia sp. AiPa1]MCL9758084.1 CYTH domain-containing protein [Frankia sp. AiPa1]
MREVEVKYAVNNLEEAAAALRWAGVEFSEPVFQDDQAFAPVGWSFGDSKRGVAFARLRSVGERHWFTLKQPGANAQDCLEYETEVLDRAAMHQAILRMGYWATVRVAKSRRAGRVGEVSLCLDEVAGVGTFLELERLVPDDAPAAVVQDELAAFAVSLNVPLVRTAETYDSLVRAATDGGPRVPPSQAGAAADLRVT